MYVCVGNCTLLFLNPSFIGVVPRCKDLIGLRSGDTTKTATTLLTSPPVVITCALGVCSLGARGMVCTDVGGWKSELMLEGGGLKG